MILLCSKCGKEFTATEGEYPVFCPPCLATVEGPDQDFTIRVNTRPGVILGVIQSGRPRPDPEPIPLRAVGRGTFRATASASGDVVQIRVDDDKDDAFWLELAITKPQLEKMLASLTDGPDTAA
jgi:hypothetical protein